MSDEIYQRAIYFLSRREYSRAELRRKLAAYSEDEAAIEAVLERLQTGNLQSDARFSESLVSAKAKNYGSLRLMDELRRKGVDADTAAEYLPTAEDELARAVAVLHKKFGLADTGLAMKQKYCRFLAYRGFDSDVVYRAVKVFIAGDSD